MSHFQIDVDGGKTIRLPTAGKYCDRDILVTGKGGDTDTAYKEGFADGFKQGEQSAFDFGKYASVIRFPNINVFGQSSLVLNLDSATTLEELVKSNSAEAMNTTVEHLTINAPDTVTSMSYMAKQYAQGFTLKRLTLNVDTRNVTNFTGVFMNNRGLEVIDGLPINASSATSGGLHHMFNYCWGLKDVRFVEGTIRSKISFWGVVLSDESLQSVINGLKDLTGETTLTIELGATNGNSLTDEQKAAITAKNWTLVY